MPFQHTYSAQDYLSMAVGAYEFIRTREKRMEHGLVWDMHDSWEGKNRWNDEISLYSGSAGIIRFLLNLYELTGKQSYLSDAFLAGDYIVWRWNHQSELSKCFSPWAYTTGWSGVAAVLLDLCEKINMIGKESDGNIYIKYEQYTYTVENIVRQILDSRQVPENGIGRYWSNYPGIVGDGGTILFLLEAAKILGNSDWKEAALEAGRYYLNKGEKIEKGKYYRGVDPVFFGYGDDYRDPNFPMGTAGIGFLLLRLFDESGDQAFLDAEAGITEYLKSIAVVNDDGTAALLPHALPYKRNLFYLSYCHGPAGTSRYFYKRFLETKALEDLEWAEKLAEGIIATGAPEIHTKGYWYIHCFCCGTAGILNLFLGLYAATDKEKYKSYADRCAEQLMGWAVTEEKNGKEMVSWYTAFDRIFPGRVTTPIGYYDGVAGIADMLLQMSTLKSGQFWAKRAIDDPFPNRMEKYL